MNKPKKIMHDKVNNSSALTNIRARLSLKNAINSEVSKLNKIKKGSKKIIPADILELLLPLLTDQHRKQILVKTITGFDRRKQAKQNYIKKHGSIKENAFFDLIQDREIDINDYLPEDLKSHKVNKKNT